MEAPDFLPGPAEQSAGRCLFSLDGDLNPADQEASLHTRASVPQHSWGSDISFSGTRHPVMSKTRPADKYHADI